MFYIEYLTIKSRHCERSEAIFKFLQSAKFASIPSNDKNLLKLWQIASLRSQ
jgi:hypothetical protein